MATISAADLAKIRREIAEAFVKAGLPVNFNKAQINAALQALEDWFEGVRSSAVTAINNATSPFVFTNAQKKKLGAYWLLFKYAQELL